MSALDQEMKLTTGEMHLLTEVDEVLEKARIEANPFKALNWGLALRRRGHISGLAQAKLLHGLQQDWAAYATDMDFFDAVLQDMGIPTGTSRKYVQLWQDIFENPAVEEQVKKALFGKPIEGLLLLPAAAREGELTPEDWKEVAEAHDKGAIRDVVQRRRPGRTSANSAIVITLDREGFLNARRGKGKYMPIGTLRNPDEVGEVERIAIERIIRAAGIVVI
jgi:hypothetical protein